MPFIRFETNAGWTFVGASNWSWDDEGTIYPPVWSNPDFLPDPSGVPNYYAYDLTREDYAFTSRPLLDFVVSVEYRSFYGSVVNGGWSSVRWTAPGSTSWTSSTSGGKEGLMK